MRFHILGLSHTKTTPEYSVCAFTQKVRHLCRMLTDQGHTVYHYGVEGSDPQATEHVSVVDAATFARVHSYDWRRDGFLIDPDNDAYRMFVSTSVEAIQRRAAPLDFLLCPFGTGHQPVAAALPDLICVESGIGYEHTFARFRVWESYAWMHFHYGKEGRAYNPPWYDAVIPNAIDPAEFEYSRQKEGYHVFLGRPTHLKGRQIAIDVCRDLHIPLFVAGQGETTVPEGVVHLGVLGPRQRAYFLSRAEALWAPTYYVEPFGTVAAEAQISGTPVITTDVGAFTETVAHGITGYRCRTYEHFLYAARHVRDIDPAACRKWAMEHFSLPRVAGMYAEYFAMLDTLHRTAEGWYRRNPGRADLDWLRPGGLPARIPNVG